MAIFVVFDLIQPIVFFFACKADLTRLVRGRPSGVVGFLGGNGDATPGYCAVFSAACSMWKAGGGIKLEGHLRMNETYLNCGAQQT